MAEIVGYRLVKEQSVTRSSQRSALPALRGISWKTSETASAIFEVLKNADSQKANVHTTRVVNAQFLLSALKFLYNHRGIVSAKTKGITQKGFDFPLLCLVKCQVDACVQLRIIRKMVDRWRHKFIIY